MEALIHTAAWCLIMHALCQGKGQLPKVMYFMTLFTCNMQNRKIHNDRQQTSSFHGFGEEGSGKLPATGTVFLSGVMRKFWNWVVVMVAQPC